MACQFPIFGQQGSDELTLANSIELPCETAAGRFDFGAI